MPPSGSLVTQRIFKKSIRTRLFLAILMPLVLVEGFLFVLYLNHIGEDYRGRYENIAQTISSPFINSIEQKLNTLESIDTKQEFLEIYADLKASIEFPLWLNEFEFLTEIAFTNARGTILTATPGGKQLSVDRPEGANNDIISTRNGSSFVVSIPLQNDGQPYAYLLFQFSDQEVSHEEQNVLFLTLLTLLLSLLIGSFLAWIISRAITKPINLLALDSKRLASGELEHEISALQLSDEIGLLAENFRLMRNSIREKIKELAKHRDQLETLVEERTSELKEAQSELIQKERLATLGRLTATVSHELRNPLGTVRNAIFAISEELDDSPSLSTKRMLDLGERNIVRCVNIIEDLLNYTRVKPLELVDTDIDYWLSNLVSEYDFPNGVEYDLNLSCAEKVLVDREKMRQVLVNLITNAIDAVQDEGAEGNHVSITTSLHGDKYKILIHDNGVGMSEETMQEIFEPLFSTKGFGVGLGMVIVKNIMDQHHGTINIESKKGEGTTVTLCLPTNIPNAQSPTN